MIVLGWLRGPLPFAVALALGVSQGSLAQQPSQLRSTSGWRASTHEPSTMPMSGNSRALADREPESTGDPPSVQTAYFQAQGGLSDGLPPLPSATIRSNTPVLPAGYGDQGTGETGGGDLVTPPVLPRNVSPPQYGSGGLRPNQSERLPSQNESAPPTRSRQNPSPQQSSLPPGQGPRLDAQNITTGYPFVTPPPRSRYATSPYQPAVFQTVSSSQPIVGRLASNVGPPSMLPPSGLTATAPLVPAQQYLSPNQAGLPQYRYPQPGIYPTGYQCTTPVPSVPTTGAVPGAYIPPTLPPNLTPGLYTPNNAGYTPLFSLGQENYNVQLGRGIIGQPTVYVPGQPVRNFMRYISP